MVEPSKILFLICNTIPQKEHRILLHNGYHSLPQKNTTQMRLSALAQRVHVGSCENHMATLPILYENLSLFFS